MSKRSLKDKILDYVFDVSTQPVRYKDLLAANALFNENMLVDPAKLNFRIRLCKAYLVYAIICLCVIVPLVLLSHLIFKDINTHIPIIGVIILTSAVFIGFNYFMYWLRETMTLKLIKKSWSIHFPYFAYDKYSKEIEKLYNEIIKKDLPRKDWEQYILDGLL